MRFRRRREPLAERLFRYVLIFIACMALVPAAAQFGFPIDQLPTGSALSGAERLLFQQGSLNAGQTVRDTLSNALKKIQAPSASQLGGVFSKAATPTQLVSGIDTSGNVIQRTLVSADLPAIAFSSLTGIPTTIAGYGITNALVTTNNLSDLINTTTARSNLGLSAIAASANANDLTAGTVGSARGGAGTINGALKGNGSGVVSQAACADLSDSTGSCSDGVIRPSGRLTLQTGVPVMGTSQSGKTTIFWTPYLGSWVPFFDGTKFSLLKCPEISNITTNSATGNAGPAAVGASSVYDLFVWNNGGTCTLTRGPVWTSASARSAGTALVLQNGILLNSLTITNGPAASRGTYVGTVASNASSQIDWTLGASSAGGTAARLMVFNYYNRVIAGTSVNDTSGSYTYTSATVRQAGGSAGNQIAFVVGAPANDVPEETASLSYNVVEFVQGTSGAFMTVGLGIDNTAAFSPVAWTFANPTAVGYTVSDGPFRPYQPTLGVHTVSANEASDGTHASTFNSGNNGMLNFQMRM